MRGGAGWLISWRVFEPLRSLARQADSIRHDDQEMALATKPGKDEVGFLSQSLSALVESLRARNRSLATTTVELEREIVLRQEAEQRLINANRLLQLMVQGGHELVRASEEDDFLAAMCRMLVDNGGFSFAWIGYHQGDCRVVKPVGWAGASVSEQDFCVLEDAPDDGCPVRMSASSNTVVVRNLGDDGEQNASWRTELERRGCRSCAAFPLVVEEEVVGALGLYSEHGDAFSNDEECELLHQLAQELALGIEAIRTKKERDRVYRDLQAAYESVEGQVVRRTQELREEIDIRRKAEAELRKLTRAVEQSSAAILVTDRDGVIEWVNPGFCSISGYERDEVIGHRSDLLKSGAHDETLYQGIWKTILSGKTWSGEMYSKMKDGRTVCENTTISPVYDKAGEITHFITVKDDATPRKELERIKEDVERIMRHDLKTPLNGIIGLPALLLMDGNLTDEQVELIKMIESSGQKMLEMIDMSLDLFKMETGQFVYHPANMDALQVLNRLAADCQSKLAAKGCRLTITVNGQTPAPGQQFFMAADNRLLYSLLANLLANAIEASPENETVSVEVHGPEPTTIAVHNKGAVPKAMRESFFEKYKTHGKTGGTGLGTYSAKMMAGVMGYSIWMEASDEENVTCVTMSSEMRA